MNSLFGSRWRTILTGKGRSEVPIDVFLVSNDHLRELTEMAGHPHSGIAVCTITVAQVVNAQLETDNLPKFQRCPILMGVAEVLCVISEPPIAHG